MQQIKFTNAYGSVFSAGMSPPFILSEIDANSVGMSAINHKPIGFDGQITASTSLNPRTISLTVSIQGELGGRWDSKEYYRLWEQAQRAFIPSKSAEGVLEYENDNGKYWIKCYPYALPNPDRVGTTGTFIVDLIADYPFWQAATPHVHHFTSGFNNIANNSGMPVPFVLEASGMGGSAWFANLTSWSSIALDGIGTATKIEIDTQLCTVKKYNGSSWEYANHLLSTDSDFKPLAVGVNQVHFSNWQSGASAKMIWYDHFLGV